MFIKGDAKYRGKKSNNTNCSDLVLGAKKKEEQAMITLQEMAVFNSLYGS